MANLGRRLIAIAALAVALIGMVVIATSGSANASTPPTFSLPPFGDFGVLRLHMGGTSDALQFDAADGSGGYTAGTPQPLTTTGCAMNVPANADLAFTPTPNGGKSQGKVGLVGHSIGVQVKGEGSGTPCGQVNGTSQALDLSLAGELANKSMDEVQLDIEGKFGVTVQAQLLLNGAVVRTESQLISSLSDSGPDSGFADNYRWKLPSSGAAYFDEIKLSVLSPTAGAFSLEGGSDGTPAIPNSYSAKLGGTLDSLFHISTVNGILQCGSTTPTEGGTNGEPSVFVTLVDTGSTCEPVPYALTTVNDGETQGVGFQKTGGDTNVYKATITWPVELAKYPPDPTLIDYYDGSGPHPLKFCDGTYTAPVTPGEPWCLLKHDAQLATPTSTSTSTPPVMQVTEELYGLGDPGYWR